jgi:hypothetical protein
VSVNTIDGRTAWSSVARSSESKWPDVAGRFEADPVIVSHQAGFALPDKARVFCMGSCFARNIEEHLIYRGVDVLSKRVVSPKSEWPARANGFLNKFTTHSMLQELRWLEEPPADPLLHLSETAEGWRDLHLTPGLQSSSLERALERRAWLAHSYFPRLRQADAVLMTLGLNEAWRDAQTGVLLNAAPSLWEVRRHPERYTVEITDVGQNLEALEEIRERLKRLNPEMKLVVTVSPVPMGATFSGHDVMVANSLSKSTLRAAAGAFEARHDDVDYFPSYEMATLSSRGFAYAPDCLHVADRVVSRIMETFLAAYLGPDHPRIAPADFTELQYLDANPDVEDKVRAGELSSGFEHWLTVGRDEGRPLRPDEMTDRARRAGV